MISILVMAVVGVVVLQKTQRILYATGCFVLLQVLFGLPFIGSPEMPLLLCTYGTLSLVYSPGYFALLKRFRRRTVAFWLVFVAGVWLYSFLQMVSGFAVMGLTGRL